MKTVSKKVFGTLLMAMLGIVCALLITCAFGVLKVQGQTMSPNIAKDSFVVINKLTYLFNAPREGDIVAFPCSVYSEDGEGSLLIKRVVATQGDVVEIKEGNLYINNRIYEKYAAEPVYMDAMDKTTVGEGKVFVLSDNREAILDSRDEAVGMLATTELTGKVCFK